MHCKKKAAHNMRLSQTVAKCYLGAINNNQRLRYNGLQQHRLLPLCKASEPLCATINPYVENTFLYSCLYSTEVGIWPRG